MTNDEWAKAAVAELFRRAVAALAQQISDVAGQS